MNILELLDGVIRKPAATLNLIAREKPVGWALGIFAASALFSAITTDYSALENVSELLTTPNIAFQITGSLVGLFLFTGYLHLLSRIFKGSGDYWGLFSALGFAQFPGFLVPIAALLKNVGGVPGGVLGGLISFGSAVWVLVLYVIALRESRGITTGASILTYLIGGLIIGGVIVIGVIGIAIMLGIFS